jgi:hypothetical protein
MNFPENAWKQDYEKTPLMDLVFHTGFIREEMNVKRCVQIAVLVGLATH